MLFLRLFIFLGFSSSSGGLGKAALLSRGTPWVFNIHVTIYVPLVEGDICFVADPVGVRVATFPDVIF